MASMFKFTIITEILLITTAINLVVLSVSWRRRKTKSGSYFAWGIMALTLWTLAASLDYASVPMSLKIFFAQLEYTFSFSALILFTLFALSYTGYEEWLKPGKKIIFAAVSMSNAALSWTNGLHGWFWASYRYSEVGENTAIFEPGPAYAWSIITGYGMILVILVSLWQASLHGSELSRRQARLLFFASLVPVIGNLIYLLEGDRFKGIDWSSITFSASGILFLMALYGTRLLDLAPIARDKLVNSLSDGMVVLDTQNRIIEINPPAIRMLASQETNLIGRSLIEIAPPIRVYLEQPPEQELKTELEIGHTVERYFDVLISPLFQEKNLLLGRLIIFRDISERKRKELRLLQLTQAVEQSPASVLIADLDGTIEYVNPQFTSLTGYTYDEVIGKNSKEVQFGQASDALYREVRQAILAGQTWQGEFINKKKEGELYWEQAVIAPVLSPEGQVLNFIALKQNITKRKHAEAALQLANQRLENQLREIESLQASLREQAVRDPLTGLYNRRFLNEVLDHEFHRAARLAQPLSIVTLDIDGFKLINDQYGHAAGDACLVRLADLLQNYIRTSDIACRYGGEEFLLVLPDTDNHSAAVFAEQFRRLLEEAVTEFNGQEISATISLGVATYPIHSTNAKELISQADKALYLSKNLGRNRVTIWSETGAQSSCNALS
jgi:diguanylate cyclase (GGDEF)-like protein/PAS domain S-box-containing protein